CREVSLPVFTLSLSSYWGYAVAHLAWLLNIRIKSMPTIL
ncbi:hypothetical protein OPV22_035193, partial [Ensete ventricosum]